MQMSHCITALCLGWFLFACTRKTADHTEDVVEVRDVVVQNVVEEAPPPPPPPPPSFKSPFPSIKAWLVKICDTEKPDTSIVAYSFGLFESKHNYMLTWTGSKWNNQFGKNVLTTDFEPKLMYYPLPEGVYRNTTLAQVQERVAKELKAFLQTAKAKQSFFGRAKAVITDFNGKNLLEEQ